MWRCEQCGTIYQQWLAMCSACGAHRCFVPAPIVTHPGSPTRSVRMDQMPGARSRGALITAKQLAAMDRPSLPLSSKWKELLGSVPGTFGLLTYGRAGEGKSTWLLTFAAELAKHGLVLYVAAEEGQASSMTEKVSRLEIITDRIMISSAISVSEMLDDLDSVEGCQFLFIDSLSCFPITAVELSEIVESRRLGVAFSVHSCKDGTYKGTTTLGHWVDTVAKIEAGEVKLEKK